MSAPPCTATTCRGDGSTPGLLQRLGAGKKVHRVSGAETKVMEGAARIGEAWREGNTMVA